MVHRTRELFWNFWQVITSDATIGNKAIAFLILLGTIVAFILLVWAIVKLLLRGASLLLAVVEIEKVTYEAEVIVNQVGKPVKMGDTYIYMCEVSYNNMYGEIKKKVWIDEETLRSGNGPYISLPSYMNDDGKVVICPSIDKETTAKFAVVYLVLAAILTIVGVILV